MKIILDVGHKMGAKWDENLSRDATKWMPNGTKNCPGRLYLSREGSPSTKKGPTKGKVGPLESIRWVLEKCLVKVVTDVGHQMGAKRDATWSQMGGYCRHFF